MSRTLVVAGLLGFALPAQAAGPDLIAKNLTLDPARHITFTLANEGDEAVPPGRGQINLYVDGRLVEAYLLDALADRAFAAPGGASTVTTTWRLGVTNRRVSVAVDARREIGESNEQQNTISRTLVPGAPSGSDLVISDLYLESGALRIQVRNLGPSTILAGRSVTYRVSLDGAAVATFAGWLPFLPAGGTHVVVPPTPIPVFLEVPVRVGAELTAARAADDIDNTNSLREETMPLDSHPDPYGLLWEPRIRAAIKWEGGAGVRSLADWTLGERLGLEAAIARLENRLPSLPLAPPALAPDNTIAPSDGWNIFLSHVAHAIWVENHALVPWRLTSFTDAQLYLLFDSRRLLEYRAGSGRYAFRRGLMGEITAWNPRISYEFMTNLGLLRTTQSSTIYALTDWMRAHLIHISFGEDYMTLYGYAGPPPADRVLYPLPGQLHKTVGCWGTSGLYAAVLRGVNIPVDHARTALSGGTHSRPAFPSVDRSLVHGDDPYTRTVMPSGAVIPASLLFYTSATMTTRFLAPAVDCNPGGECNTVDEQASYNSGRDHLSWAYVYRADYLLNDYAAEGAAHLDDTLRGPRIGGEVVEYARPFFTAAERAAMVANVEARVMEIGGGDLEAGKAIVRERVGRFSSNK